MEIKHLSGVLNSKLPFDHSDVLLKPELQIQSDKNTKLTSCVSEQKLIEHVEQINKFIEPTKTTIRF